MLRSEQKDLIHYVSKLGKGIKSVFTSFNNKETINSSEHSLFTFGFVYANNLANAEMEKEKPNFPVGSIIVREKNLTADAETPETVIAMVKREKDFSKKTGDWEFFVFEGKDLKIQSRETKGNCAECHSNAKQTDWVFREYLK